MKHHISYFYIYCTLRILPTGPLHQAWCET